VTSGERRMGMNKSTGQWNSTELQLLKDSYRTKSINEISIILNRSLSSIHHKANRLNLSKVKLPDVETLNKMYHNENKSTLQLAKIYSTTPQAVRLKLIRNGKTIRTQSEGQELNSYNIRLSKEGSEYLNGLMLGDGCITILKKNGKSATYKHIDKNLSYVKHLKHKLESFGFKCSEIGIRKQNGKQYYYISTRCYRDLIGWHNKWYVSGKKLKQIPSDLILTPVMLKNWYIGDGSYSKPYQYVNKKTQHIKKNLGKIILAIQEDRKGKELMSEQLTNLGINNSLHHQTIYIHRDSINKFFTYMLSTDRFIPDCYNYKFPEAYQWA
jgi:hypothetical protein